MRAKLANQIEATSTATACLGFGAAWGYAAYSLLGSMADDYSMPAIVAICIGACFYLVSNQALARATVSGRSMRSATFDLFTIPVEPTVEELLLTEVHAPKSEVPDALVLDDILAELGPDSRVVRLFDRTAMPTPAQLKSRIDAHLDRSTTEVRAPDATQALHEALAELRRSMR
jgi:hypothetical protein